MTKIKTLKEIKDLLNNDFGIKNISGAPIITTNEEETSAIFSNTIPSIYYRKLNMKIIKIMLTSYLL